MKTEFAYTLQGAIHIPSVKIAPETRPAGSTFALIRGMAYTVAVQNAAGVAIGWAACEDYGCARAADMLNE